MTINQRIKAFVTLGKFLKQFEQPFLGNHENELNNHYATDLEDLIKIVHTHNGWFTEVNVRIAIAEIANMLNEEELVEWMSNYVNKLSLEKAPKRVAVIMAGNIPMVGFHDMLCILMSGNKLLAKLSSDDHLLLPFITKVLIAIEPEFKGMVEFTNNQVKDIDAVIATGNNNSARYFEYYFGKYPHIIRKNRNSVAVLTGNETQEELLELGKDIFQYFGLGCRSVSKLFVPKDYNFDHFYSGIYSYSDVISHNKYNNNYEYNRTIYLMSQDSTLLDNNFLLLKGDSTSSSPIGVLYYEFYDDLKQLNDRLQNEKEDLQCVVSKSDIIKNALSPGKAQCPKLSDYADGIDTLQFLIDL